MANIAPSMPQPRSRASQPPRSHTEPLASSSSAVREALEDAARVVLDDSAAWRTQALGADEAETVMGGVTAFIAGDPGVDEEAQVGCGGIAALTLRLSDLLRQELLRDPRGLCDGTLLDVMRRIEQCRARLDSRAHQEIAFLLTGANALELVVEFAHDLRSPLTSIMFLAETLRKGQSGEINDVQRGQLAIVYSAALGMVEVANDLMDLAGSEVDQHWGRSPEERFSLHEVFESARNMVAPMVEQKRLDMGYLTPDQDVRIGYPVLLNRVLLNLLTNAIKFTDQGRIEMVAEDLGAGRVEFSVSDTGRGMGPAELESLYILFGRSQSKTGYHFSGTGLGLSICKRMVDMMGGELRVESRRGEGTRFWFEIDLPPQ